MRTIVAVAISLACFMLIILSSNMSGRGSTSHDVLTKVQPIINQTMAADGYLTPEMHSAFWNHLDQYRLSDDFEDILQYMEISLLDAQRYQKEAWRCAKISYQTQQVFKSDLLLSLQRNALSRFKNALPYPKGSSRYESEAEAYAFQHKRAVEDTDRILEAAANRSSVTLHNGDEVNINLEDIDYISENIEASFNRLKNLLNRHWVPIPEY